MWTLERCLEATRLAANDERTCLRTFSGIRKEADDAKDAYNHAAFLQRRWRAVLRDILERDCVPDEAINYYLPQFSELPEDEQNAKALEYNSGTKVRVIG